LSTKDNFVETCTDLFIYKLSPMEDTGPTLWL